MRGSINSRTTLGFTAVISAAIAMMPLLVETGPLSPGDASVAPRHTPVNAGESLRP